VDVFSFWVVCGGVGWFVFGLFEMGIGFFCCLSFLVFLHGLLLRLFFFVFGLFLWLVWFVWFCLLCFVWGFFFFFGFFFYFFFVVVLVVGVVVWIFCFFLSGLFLMGGFLICERVVLWGWVFLVVFFGGLCLCLVLLDSGGSVFSFFVSFLGLWVVIFGGFGFCYGCVGVFVGGCLVGGLVWFGCVCGLEVVSLWDVGFGGRVSEWLVWVVWVCGFVGWFVGFCGWVVRCVFGFCWFVGGGV